MGSNHVRITESVTKKFVALFFDFVQIKNTPFWEYPTECFREGKFVLGNYLKFSPIMLLKFFQGKVVL